MTPREGEYVVKLLMSLNGSLSLVTLTSGVTFRVMNTVYGRDFDEEFDHISTNMTPPQDHLESDFFYSSEVQEITGEDGTVLFRATTHHASS